MSGRCWRGLPGETQLSFSFSLCSSFSASPAIKSCSKVPWPGWQGRGGIPFLCGVERASQPGMAPGQGGWESPRASDLRRMSCVRILAQRVWSTCRVQALLVPCRTESRCLALGRTEGFFFGEGDEDFQTGTTWRSDEGVACKRTKQHEELPVWVLTGSSYWVQYHVHTEYPKPCPL
jgi:hypothetical protein